MLLSIVLATSAWLLVMAAALLALCGLISRAKRLRDSGRGWVMRHPRGFDFDKQPTLGRSPNTPARQMRTK